MRATQGCALVVTPESRRPTLSVIPSEWNEPRDLQPGTAAALDGGTLPWGRPHEGISVLCETTFAFQRAKPIVVSPFENPFPTRGRGPWTPRGAAGSRGCFRMPSTGRDAPTASCSVLPFRWLRVTFWEQGRVLFSVAAGIPGWRSLGSLSLARDDRQGKAPRPRGFTGSLPSCQRCHTLESRRLTLTVIPTEPAGRLEGSPCWNRCCLVSGLSVCSQKVIR